MSEISKETRAFYFTVVVLLFMINVSIVVGFEVYNWGLLLTIPMVVFLVYIVKFFQK